MSVLSVNKYMYMWLWVYTVVTVCFLLNQIHLQSAKAKSNHAQKITSTQSLINQQLLCITAYFI